jgi:CheY-like chemotaxis protein
VKDLSESRVLVVDDAQANVAVLVEALVASTGRASPSAAKGPPADRKAHPTSSCSTSSAGIDGYEVCRRIRARRLRDLP